MRTLPFLVLLILPLLMQAQEDIRLRSAPDESLYPFIHGVASGDPLTDRVILWTRLTTDDPGPWYVQWQIAEDTSFTDIVAQGISSTGPDRDFTVKVDATGLEDNHWYYYRFRHQGRPSITGRTRTLPSGSMDALRLAVLSCTCYQCGYFNPYERLAQRNDVDLVLHLGDYYYEYPAFGYGFNSFVDRVDEPANELLTLEAYRIRHGWYKLDPQSRAIHQQFPFLITYDDHETANDAWRDGAQNHTESTEGDWRTRQQAAYRAWLEWMPVRHPDSMRTYRRISGGPLVDFFVFDTRLYRDKQDATAIDNPNRTMLGRQQYNWLVRELAASTATWKVVLNQVMMAPLLNYSSVPIYYDQWDGYRYERTKLFDTLHQLGIQNLLVLTGDIHSAWVNELPHYPAGGDTVQIGVECICSSVSALDRGINTWLPSVLYLLNPHIRFAKTSGRGFLTVDIRPNQAQCDQWSMTTLTRNTSESALSQWRIPDGISRAFPESLPALPLAIYPALAPPQPYRDCPRPVASGLDSLGNNAAVITWSRVSNATRYSVEGGPVGGLTKMISTADTFRLVAPLDTATAYTWRVLARCGSPWASLWTPWQFFSTLGSDSASREQRPQNSINGAIHCLGAYPNPFQDFVAVKLHLTVPGHVTAQLSDMAGRVVWNQDLGLQPDGLLLRHFENLGSLPAGSYRLHLQLDGVHSGGWSLTKP